MRQAIPLIRANEHHIAWVLVALILGSYSWNLLGEASYMEPYHDYYDNIAPKYMTCRLDQIPMAGDVPYRNFLKSWLNCAGYKMFGGDISNDRLLPILFSIGCVYLVYLLAHSMTRDRLMGLVAMQAMAMNPLLTKFDSSPTYDQAWAFFLLLGVVLMYRGPAFSAGAYLLGIFSKIYAAAFLPMLIIHSIMEKRGRGTILSYCVLAAGGISAVLVLGVGSETGFYPDRIEEGFLRIFEALWPILPAFIFLFAMDMIIKTRGTARNLSLLWMFWIMLTIPVTYLFSQQFMFGYRFVPFAAFMSVYAGIIVVRMCEWFVAGIVRAPRLKTAS